MEKENGKCVEIMVFFLGLFSFNIGYRSSDDVEMTRGQHQRQPYYYWGQALISRAIIYRFYLKTLFSLNKGLYYVDNLVACS